MEHGVAHPPMMLVPMAPLCYYYTPLCAPQEISVPPELTPVVPRKCAPEEDRESRTVPAEEEEVYHILAEAYDHPRRWRCLEERLWVRATPLQTMESCYTESEGGDYALWGNAIADFERVFSWFSLGCVYFHLAGMEARVISQDQACATLEVVVQKTAMQ